MRKTDRRSWAIPTDKKPFMDSKRAIPVVDDNRANPHVLGAMERERHDEPVSSDGRPSEPRRPHQVECGFQRSTRGSRLAAMVRAFNIWLSKPANNVRLATRAAARFDRKPLMQTMTSTFVRLALMAVCTAPMNRRQ